MSRFFSIRKILLCVLLVAVFVAPQVTHAVPINTIRSIATASSVGFNDCESFACLLFLIIETALQIVFIVSVMFLIISGLRMTTSGGNEEAVTKAKQGMTWAIAGLLVSLFAWIIVVAVSNLAGGRV